jgi:3-hydroxybutyryl-CoA dehydrogenase
MGTGIGIVASRVAAVNVVFVDPSEASLKKSEAAIAKWCDKEMSKDRMTESAK